MKSPTDRLATLRVRDVMHTDVATVAAHQTMGEASEALVDHQISGAPVVDDKGRCVGVLTATDFVRHQRTLHKDEDRFCRSKTDFGCCGQSPLEATVVRGDVVSAWMSPAIQTIDADASLLTAANEMCLAHLHRLFVLDGHGRPIGVLTTLDLVAAMVNAIEESKIYPTRKPGAS
jgi:CBS-domain-containing membrane protein